MDIKKITTQLEAEILLPQKNVSLINSLVKLLRRYHLEKSEISIQEVESEESFQTALQNHSGVALNYLSCMPYQVKSLYHYVPTRLLDLVLSVGLLPGFLCNTSELFFVYTSLEPDADWISSDNIVSSPLYYDRGGYLDREFSQVEIEYVPELEAYMWMQCLQKIHDVQFRRSMYNHGRIAVSSRAIPLNVQVGELVQNDQKLLEDYNAGKYPDMYIEGCKYSHVLDQQVPFPLLYMDVFEFSEVLLNYVPPRYLHVM